MKKEIVFMVDDSAINLTIAEKGLRDFYECITIPSGKRLFELLEFMLPSLILLDITMPVMDGFQVLEQLKQDPRFKDIPVIFLTGLSDEKVETRGFSLGAVDFVTKPFSIPRLLNRIKMHINIDRLVKTRASALEQMHRDLLFVLADIMQNRNGFTRGQIARTIRYVEALINSLLYYDIYASEIESWDLSNTLICASLYDIGKLGVSDVILQKSGKLNYEELEEMKTHPFKGTDIINSIINTLGEHKYLTDACLFAEFHHENWDGSGYPHGLSGTKIPLQGRIVALTSMYDALVSKQPHKAPISYEAAAQAIKNESGRMLDPKLVTVFDNIKHEFEAIHREYAEAQ